MPAGSESVKTNWSRRVLSVASALLALALGGPVLSIAIILLLTALLLCGCVALLVVAVPFAAFNTTEYQVEVRATASLEAEILAHPLPAHVELFVEAYGWKFSSTGNYVLFQVDNQSLIMNVTTRVMQPVKMRYNIRADDAVWLDDHWLFIYQSQVTYNGYGFSLFKVRNAPEFTIQEFWLPAVRADKASATMLDNKELFKNKDSSTAQVVAIDETGGWVIDAYSETEQQALEALMAGRETTAISYRRSAWRPLERYDSPDGSRYAAIWPLGARLAIIRPGGEIVAETYATDYSPPSANCSLTPIRWLPNSRGVLFSVDCLNVHRAILLLSIPDR